MKLKLLVLSLLASGNIMAQQINPLDCSTTAHANSALGNHTTQTIISGYGAYNIINTSNQARTYDIYMSL